MKPAFKQCLMVIYWWICAGACTAAVRYWPGATEPCGFVSVALVFISYVYTIYSISKYLDDIPQKMYILVLIYGGLSCIICALIAVSIDKFGLIYSPGNPNDCVTYGDATYFSVITFTSVGYGDFIPTSGEGKLMASVLAIFGNTHAVAFLSVSFWRLTRPTSEVNPE